MAFPVFIGAGAGATITGASGTVSKSNCVQGNLIVAVALVNGTQTAGFTNSSNIEDMNGVDSSITSAPGGPFGVGSGGTAGNQTIAYGRVMANGTCSVDANVTSDDMVARLYEFANVKPAIGVAGIIDNTAAGNGMRQSIGTSTTPGGLNPAVTTSGTDRLAIAFVAIVGNVTVTSMTGESGADWIEAVAAYSDTPGTIQLQTAEMASAGSINPGGSQTISSSLGWAVDTTAFIGGGGLASVAWITV